MHSGLIDLHILLYHHLLERLEVVDREDLLNNSIVGGIACTLFTGGFELLASDAHLRNKFAEELIDEFEEILKRGRNGGIKGRRKLRVYDETYHVNVGVL